MFPALQLVMKGMLLIRKDVELAKIGRRVSKNLSNDTAW